MRLFPAPVALLCVALLWQLQRLPQPANCSLAWRELLVGLLPSARWKAWVLRQGNAQAQEQVQAQGQGQGQEQAPAQGRVCV